MRLMRAQTVVPGRPAHRRCATRRTHPYAGRAVNPEFLFQALVFMDSRLGAAGRAPE
jgi:hypothetical protein